jgi:hypothetical protein
MEELMPRLKIDQDIRSQFENGGGIENNDAKEMVLFLNRRYSP